MTPGTRGPLRSNIEGSTLSRSIRWCSTAAAAWPGMASAVIQTIQKCAAAAHCIRRCCRPSDNWSKGRLGNGITPAIVNGRSLGKVDHMTQPLTGSAKKLT